jgi:hypothetical protein
MSTAIATTEKTIDYPALAPNSRQARIIAANLDGEPMMEKDLVKVPTPLGGSTTWNIDIDGNVESTDEIVGLLVAVASRGVLWPSATPTEQRPILVSHDLITGYRVSDDLGSEIDPEALEKYRIGDRRYDWAALSTGPEFGFGSSGSGRRVKESRLLAILRQGEVWPLLVKIGPGSLGEWDSFSKRLPCFRWEAIVGLRLAKAKGASGNPYSQVVPRLVGEISEEQGQVAHDTYTVPLKVMFARPPVGATVTVTVDAE